MEREGREGIKNDGSYKIRNSTEIIVEIKNKMRKRNKAQFPFTKFPVFGYQ